MKITIPQCRLDEKTHEDEEKQRIVETAERIVRLLDGMSVKMAERILNRARVEIDAHAIIKG